MSIPIRRTANPLFGQTTLAASGNGTASWLRGTTSPLDQKGSTGWLAKLYGGVQTGVDWARVNIPVDEIFLTDFNYAMWSYYMTGTQTMGVNIVVWMHDPKDFDKRAEVTQLGGHADLVKTAGWNAFSFSPSTGGMFFYGENTTGTGLTAGTQYTWSQFQADVLFSKWSIYRITIEYGWEASGTFDYVYVADIKLNGIQIALQPGIEVVLSNAAIDIGDVTLLAGTAEIGKLAAGTALIGKVGIDQTTPGTTNGVARALATLLNSGVKSADAVIKGSAGAVYWISVSDTAALLVEIENHATGGGTNVWAIDLPAGGYGHFIFDPPIECSLGIYLDVSTATCKVTIGYK